MHIKKLEISGFKSFVDKTVVHFDHDVIGIVGPNGCGKSNIVDAIRWCMGEQSAKHLRGRAMEDVIFNGSESRPPHGLAEVTLTFDNADKGYAQTLPEEYREYAEIAVTRRLFRDGTSEYLINKASVRLRDVTDLFLGTGVGTKAYSIVEQGRIGQIVSSRPQDRRMYIEEAAGITKYKLRRKQAERKMDLTRQNLLRITDIVSEIDRNRGALKRQSAKAERYVQYRAELEDLFLHDASHRLLEMLVLEQAEGRFLETVREQSSAVSISLASGEEQLVAARNEASAIEQRYDVCTQTSALREQRVTQSSSDVERSQDRLNHLGDRLSTLTTERVTLEAKLELLGGEREQLELRTTELGRDEAELSHDAEHEHTSLLELHGQERAAEQAVNAERMRSATIRTDCATLNARIESSEQRRADTELRNKRTTEERSQLGTEIERTRLRDAALRSQVDELRASKEQSSDHTGDLERELSVLRPERRETARKVEAVRSELNLKRSRLRVLQDLHQSLEGLGAGTKALLTAGDPTVLGILADRLEVEPRFTEAFAGLLGDRLQCVIVEDPARGLELLEELKQGNKGRATISPLRPVADRSTVTGAERDARVLALLVDQIRFRPEDAGLVRALIGNAVVVETAKQALEVNAEYGGVTAVALDGTVVTDSAVVAGGCGDNVASAMIEQKREIRQLTEWVAGFELELTSAVEHHADVEHRIAELESALELSRKTLHERELRHVTAEKDLARAEGELERLTARHARLVEEAGELDARMNEFSLELSASRLHLEGLRAEEQAANEALAAAEVHFSACKQQSAEQASRVTERKVRIAQVREQLDAARGALQRLANDAALSQDRLALVVQEAAEAQQQSQETQERLSVIRETLVLAESEAQDSRRELDTVRALLDQVRLGVGQHEAELRQFRAELSEQEERSRQHEMRLQKWSLEKAHLIQNVRERFRGLDLPRVVGDYHARPAPDAEHRRRIDELSKLIDRMGPVNLDAQAEYEDAERRFSELNSQKEDIDKALMELDRAIKHMDRESKRRFKETFDAVNELFRSTFTRLFKGGRGELKLTDPEDILETGVDIIAQPPGKKLGNIELMSGGEKALTATALIFAIFQYRPSPFCILDEVDAPLDEANVTRYNEAIRAMTANSQFVVITHIKKTMQSVDVLYGVTMGEPGVSRLVSVKVNDEAKSRSEKTPSNFVPPLPAPELRFPDILEDEASVQVA